MIRCVVPLLALLIACPAARAVIAAKTPPSSIYASAAAVVTGTVTSISPDSGTVEATATSLTGQPLGDTLKFKLTDLPQILAGLKPNAPVVLFLGKRSSSSAVHLADTWLFPEPVPGSKSNFVVRKDLESNLRQSYPGTTAALVKLVEELKANNGKYSMLNEVSPKMFHGGAKDLGNLDGPGPIDALFAANLHGDKRQYVVARSRHGFQPFEVSPFAVRPMRDDAPRPKFPPIPPADVIALSVVNTGDKPALLALRSSGELLLAQDGGGAPQTKRLWTDNAPVSAAALGAFGEDPDKIYALVVKDDNLYRYPLDGSGPPADFARLTGEKAAAYHRDNPKWLAGASARPLDCNGDGRPDLLINTPSGPMLLINRGFGAFFINAEIGKSLVDVAGKPVMTDKSRWTAADVDADGHDDLLVLSPDGKLTAVMNPKADDKK